MAQRSTSSGDVLRGVSQAAGPASATVNNEIMQRGTGVRNGAVNSLPIGHILGHIRPQPDATRPGQTQKVPVFFSRNVGRWSQTQPDAKEW